MRPTPAVLAIFSLPFVTACSGSEPSEGSASEHTTGKIQALSESDVLTNRSLAVTEVAITDRFNLQDVLEQLLAQAGANQQTAQALFDSWVDTQVNCPNLSGFSMTCRSGEAFDTDPFPPSPFRYTAMGLFNRFDLAPADGSDCGEYRIVFGREHNDFGQEKTLIFEARLPNPTPEEGLAGCRPVVDFWASLSDVEDITERGDLLLDFFFEGLDGFAPAIHVDHFLRQPGSGQIRTNSFLSIQEWNLREFGLSVDCATECELSFVPHATDENPFIELSRDGSTDPRAAGFQDWFVDSLELDAGLLTDNLFQMTFPVPEEFNGGQSLLPESRAFPLTVPNLADEAGPLFTDRVEAKLTQIGSTLNAEQVLARANSMTCNGCHNSSIGDDLGFRSPFPSIDRFRHVQLSLDSMDAPDGPRHRMSEALKTEFLPARLSHLVEFLNTTAPLGFSATLQLQSSWSTGYCAEVSVNNDTDSASSWLTELDLQGGTLTNLWNANYSLSGSVVSATPPSWQSQLAAGAQASFGFCVSHGGSTPTAEILSVEPQ